MSDYYRMTVSIPVGDKKKAEKLLDDEKARRRVPQSLRLPAYCSLLIERQILVEEQERAAPTREPKSVPRRTRAKRRV